MATLNWSSARILRCSLSLRSIFLWLLLALLLTGAASYTHGSRYAIVPADGPVQSMEVQGTGAVPLQAESAAIPAGNSAWEQRAVRAVHHAGPCADPEAPEKDCCQRRQAPRSEPSPLRTGAVDPPTLRQTGGGIFLSDIPPEPDLPALTVIGLSISRT